MPTQYINGYAKASCVIAISCESGEIPYSRSSPLHLCEGRLRLGQPEGHGHGAIHLDGDGQPGTGLLLLLGLGIQRAQAMVAVGLEGAHSEFLSQGKGLLVMDFSLLDLWRLALCRDFAEEA